MNLVFTVSSNAIVVGNITKAKGKVQIIKENSFKGVDYKIFGGKLEVKDIVRTKRKSFANILFIDNTKVFLEEKSRLIIENFIPDKDVSLYTPSGKVIYKVVKRVKGKFKVKTPTALIGVKGTKFMTVVKDGITYVFTFKGTVEVINPKFPKKSVKLTSGTFTIIKKDKHPSSPVKFNRQLINKIVNLTLKPEEKEKNYIYLNIEESFSESQSLFIKDLEAVVHITGTPNSLNMDLYLPQTELPQ